MCCGGACLCVCTVLVAAVASLVANLLLAVTPCDRDAAGACKHAYGLSTTRCAGGVFVQLARQPALALLHAEVGEKTPLARLANGACVVQYSLACDDGIAQVHEAWSCSQDLDHLPPAPVPVGHGWEVCASPGGVLTVLRSLIDLTWDADTPVASLVPGCVKVSPPGQLPELAAVRGGVEAQRAALQRRKKLVGGCPTWGASSADDRQARASDFLVVGQLTAAAVRQYMIASQERVAVAALNSTRPVPRQIALQPLLAAIGPEAALEFVGWATCGEPAPLPLLTASPIGLFHHADVASWVTDRSQERAHVLGGPAGEVCFDQSLPIFLSTGGAEHTQTRRLWDEVGLATMHLQALPDVREANTLLATARRAVGIQAPLMLEIAEMVAPLFATALWGQEPSREVAGAIASYATYGAACAQSQVLAELPLVPGKIRAIRETVLAFARETPTGKALAQEIQKPEYAELRTLYESRGRPAGDVAVQNLADASMFAGLLGTSAMTEQCVQWQLKDPEYVRLFRRNSSAFLYEAMRLTPVVSGSQGVLKEPWQLRAGGSYIEVPRGATKMGVLSVAGMDARVFPDPLRFDTARPNIGEMLAWNGPLHHALARDYAHAPRFCPGAAASVAIASKVCTHATKHLSE